MIDRRGFLGLAVCGPAFVAAARALRPEPSRIGLIVLDDGTVEVFIDGRHVRTLPITFAGGADFATVIEKTDRPLVFEGFKFER